ncbi:MAG: phycobilisome rod-core linker polypeptide [Crocosphaera sp.]|nr:phycobilisome rod-core linker polypeptide [Crocosphaera sp.]
MQTAPNYTSLIKNPPRHGYIDPSTSLNAIYRQLFKENRSLDFFYNLSLNSRFLNGELNTRQFVCELLCSEMYQDYILATNSNYHFVTLCFERVLGRPPEQQEKFQWSSFLATQGLRAFAENLTSTEEYLKEFGEDLIPTRRSLKLFSSDQNLPALPKEQSIKRYQGEGNINQFGPNYYGSVLRWQGTMPPTLVRKAGAVLTVAGAIEITRIIIIIALAAFRTGSF